jgi:hypothetical protein
VLDCGSRCGRAQIWDASGVDYQARYEAIRKPEYPPTFDEYLAQRDPLLPIKMHVNLIIKAFDNHIVGAHINRMPFAVIDLSASPHRLLLSERRVEIFNLDEANGLISIPISPTKLFVAANEEATFGKRRNRSDDLVRHVNLHLVSRARRFVWACFAACRSSHVQVADRVADPVGQALP